MQQMEPTYVSPVRKENLNMHLLISVHLWRYEGGYPALTEVMSKLRDDKVKPSDFCQYFLTFLVTSGLEFPFLS